MEKEYDNKGFIKNLKIGVRIRVQSTYYTKISEANGKAIVLVEKKGK